MIASPAHMLGRGLAWLFSRAPRLARPVGRGVLRLQSGALRGARRKRIEDALSTVGLAPELAGAIVRLPAAFVLDVMELQHAPPAFLLDRPVRLSGVALERVKARHRQGKGLVLGCSNFGCFYRALLACRGVFDDILIVIGSVPYGEQTFRTKLEALSSARIRLVPVGKHSGISIARQLASGGVVATMLDTYLPGTKPLVAPFLGRPAAAPAGIYQLVNRTGATIVPVFCLRRRGYMEIELGDMIDGGSGEPVDVAAAVNSSIGAKILAEPDQWMMWHTLQGRWAAAVELPAPGPTVDEAWEPIR